MEQKNFIFTKYEFKDTILKLFYNTDDYEFVEEIDFYKAPELHKMKALDRAFRYLHLVAGVSYYKTFLPKNIIVKTGELNEEEKHFLETIYFNGLGEFSYKNKVLLDINFPSDNFTNKVKEFLSQDNYVEIKTNYVGKMKTKEDWKDRNIIKNIDEFYKNNGNLTENKEIGEIEVCKKTINETIRHKYGKTELNIEALYNASELFKNATLLKYNKNWKNRGYDSYLCACSMKIGRKKYIAEMIVNKYQLHKNIYIQKGYIVNIIEKAELENCLSETTGRLITTNPNLLHISIILNAYKNVNLILDDFKLSDNVLLPIGGGKDSIVAYQLFKEQNPTKKICTFSVNTARPIKDCCDAIGEQNILVTRKIAPQLLELVKNNIGYNGHVPISAIICLISVCAGIIYDCNTTIIANEKSASVGNVEYQGRIINHQWSKSLEAEQLLHNFIQKYIKSDYNYYSILRPYYEIKIAEMFSKYKKYHAVFSSCNKNFKITGDRNEKVWCCDCPKCRFVFLILAPFMTKNEMVNIFGENLLEDEKQLDGYKELTGLNGHKPFECVGEIEECILAFLLLKKKWEFKDDYIVKNIGISLKNYGVEDYDAEEFKNKYLI